MNIAILRQEAPISVRIAQVAGITASAFLAGQSASVTWLFTPSLLLAPAPLLAQQWKSQWLRLHTITLPMLGGPAGLFGWLAYRGSSSLATKLYITSSVLLTLIIPYTILLTQPYTEKIMEKADSLATTSLEDKSAEAGIAKEETVHALVDKWATFNLGRGIMAGIAAVSAAWAALLPTDL